MNQDRPLSDILDECIARIAQGESVDACLADYPTYAAELRDDLEAAAFFQSAFAFEPNAARKRAARLRMHAAIEHKGHRWLNLSALIPHGLFASGSRIAATVAVGILALIGSGTGTVYASQGSSPGDLLYPVKRTGEQVQLALAFSDEREIELLERFVARRMDELAHVTVVGKEQFIADLVEDLVDYNARTQKIVAAPIRDAVASLPPIEDDDISGAGDGPSNIAPIATPAPAPTSTPVERDSDRGTSRKRSNENVSVTSALTLAGELGKIDTRLLEIEELVLQESSREVLKDLRQELNKTRRSIETMLRRTDQLHAPLPTRPDADGSGLNFTFVLGGRVTATVQDVVLRQENGKVVAVEVDVILEDGNLLPITIERGGTRLLKNGKPAGIGQILIGQTVTLGVEATTGEVTTLNILVAPARQRQSDDPRSQNDRSANANAAAPSVGARRESVN